MNEAVKITVYYRSVDRFSQSRTFRTLAGAQKYAAKWVGETPDMVSNYAVSPDGIGRIMVKGATLADLFPATQPAKDIAHSAPVNEPDDWQFAVCEAWYQPADAIDSPARGGSKVVAYTDTKEAAFAAMRVAREKHVEGITAEQMEHFDPFDGFDFYVWEKAKGRRVQEHERAAPAADDDLSTDIPF